MIPIIIGFRPRMDYRNRTREPKAQLRTSHRIARKLQARPEIHSNTSPMVELWYFDPRPDADHRQTAIFCYAKDLPWNRRRT